MRLLPASHTRDLESAFPNHPGPRGVQHGGGIARCPPGTWPRTLPVAQMERAALKRGKTALPLHRAELQTSMGCVQWGKEKGRQH